MLSHLQNLQALRGWRCTGSGEAQGHELINSLKNVPVLQKAIFHYGEGLLTQHSTKGPPLLVVQKIM
jgi:hypothetical protein